MARAINDVWIASLLLSLNAALVALMGKDWVVSYSTRPVCNDRQWAELRAFRLGGVRRWLMPQVVSAAPVLLHTSLQLFAVGLVLFFSSIDRHAAYVAIGFSTPAALLYCAIAMSGAISDDSPYRSSATVLPQAIFRFIIRAIRILGHLLLCLVGCRSGLRYAARRPAKDGWITIATDHCPKRSAAALLDIYNCDPSSEVLLSCFNAVADISLGQAVAAELDVQMVEKFLDAVLQADNDANAYTLLRSSINVSQGIEQHINRNQDWSARLRVALSYGSTDATYKKVVKVLATYLDNQSRPARERVTARFCNSSAMTLEGFVEECLSTSIPVDEFLLLLPWLFPQQSPPNRLDGPDLVWAAVPVLAQARDTLVENPEFMANSLLRLMSSAQRDAFSEAHPGDALGVRQLCLQVCPLTSLVVHEILY